MTFHLKIFLIFAIVVVLLFSAINFLTIYFFNEEQQRHERELLLVYGEILKHDKNYQLPLHIKRFGEELSIDEQYAKERFIKYSKTVLFWEGLFILVLSYLFYRVLSLISKKEMEHEDFLKFLFFILSHKIGNFLSTMKTNIEIMRLRPEDKVIERLQLICNLMSDELNKTMETIKKVSKHSKDKQKISLKELIENILTKFQTEKKIIISKRDAILQINKSAFESILFLLLDNAVRYAHSRIHIKVCKNAIAIRNDFSEILKGSGLGLQIAQYLCRIHKLSVTYRAKGEFFIVFLKFK